ncbi:hypothetical protein B0T46_24385 [Nocardia donostiensis]|uniref:Uncharacterized protein n=1 Tax=Nocardia donostiensis TaxID=1538463 RepID=A0A1V2T9M6_9NOCA|nr:hypothetical protein B0T46_24385 [Nocardia donostiensis]
MMPILGWISPAASHRRGRDRRPIATGRQQGPVLDVAVLEPSRHYRWPDRRRLPEEADAGGPVQWHTPSTMVPSARW